MTNNPNTTPQTEVYREGVSLLADLLDGATRRLRDVKQQHLDTVRHQDGGVRAVNEYRLHLALTLLADVAGDLRAEAQDGVAP